MRCGLKLLRVMVLAAAIVPFGVRVSWAHDGAPDPRMLLNLDLFSDEAGTDSGNGSMLERIRTLQAMGYLRGANPPAPQPVYSSPPPPPPQDSEDDVTE